MPDQPLVEIESATVEIALPLLPRHIVVIHSQSGAEIQVAQVELVLKVQAQPLRPGRYRSGGGSRLKVAHFELKSGPRVLGPICSSQLKFVTDLVCTKKPPRVDVVVDVVDGSGKLEAREREVGEVPSSAVPRAFDALPGCKRRVDIV
jgi:hypothetical protein